MNAEERDAWLAPRRCEQCPWPGIAQRQHLFDPRLGYTVVYVCPEHGVVSAKQVVEVSAARGARAE